MLLAPHPSPERCQVTLMPDDPPSITIVIPIYGRDAVLETTLCSLLELQPPAAELLVIDQTPRHDAGLVRLPGACQKKRVV